MNYNSGIMFTGSDKRLRNEKAKVFPCPMEEHDALIDIRTHVDEAHTDMLMLKSTNQKVSFSFNYQ
ncbi:hypothetical protein DEO72_LG5g2477 [Vigna unguiculata]|uniref:Uncharacterized protein n=1 Tax=Vigna unguiculata TaxID=3917 RepID=A0A4D6M2W4_VIGUN|nr:hypothetical protein DEO72_LG5g2477 [Vigna unguiculata]